MMELIGYLFRQIDRRQLLLLYSLLVVALIFAFYYYYFEARLKLLMDLNAEVKNIQLELDEKKKYVDNFLNDTDELITVEAELVELKKKINPFFEPYNIINNLDSYLSASGLTLNKFDLSDVKEIQIDDDVLDSQLIYTSDVILKLSGDYDSVLKLISEIMNDDNYYKISNIQLAFKGETVELSLSLNVFFKEKFKFLNEELLHESL